MTLDVAHAEYAGGGPGFALVRLSGRARAAAPTRLALPALLIADGPSWRRLACVPGTALPAAGPDGPAFAVDFEVPLHLAVDGGAWWLEPGPTVQDGRVEQLAARVAALGAEVAALRQRVERDAATVPTDGAPTSAAVAVPRPRLRALRPTLPALLVAAGALALGDAAATVLWQEPVSALWAAHQQHGLAGDLQRLDQTFATRSPATAAAAALPASPQVRMRALATELERRTDGGRAVGELRIPRIDAHFVVVQGTGTASLRRGPGHYTGTALPGQPGTVGIAGHRTTYGAPFRHLDALRRGDAIDVTMPYGRFTYRVEGARIVKPEDVSALRDAGRQRLVLTACHPLYSAAKRLIVIARLERAAPRGAAAA
ncbi:MAG TPA: class E sortase [Baekduia sp.]|uniref:class E sortase n=1 Tax=Baekduia sp. TaxID=2600305 RepID=UPI002B7F141D|nr:class E sortase [Baekduia sp.]HMJ34770.1 class E sortase [Baekduia sp.]